MQWLFCLINYSPTLSKSIIPLIPIIFISSLLKYLLPVLCIVQKIKHLFLSLLLTLCNWIVASLKLFWAQNGFGSYFSFSLEKCCYVKRKFELLNNKILFPKFTKQIFHWFWTLFLLHKSKRNLIKMSETEERNVGRITIDTCALFICDLQEKFRPAIYKFEEIISNTSKLGKNLMTK